MIQRGDIRWFRFKAPEKRRPVVVLGHDKPPSLPEPDSWHSRFESDPGLAVGGPAVLGGGHAGRLCLEAGMDTFGRTNPSWPSYHQFPMRWQRPREPPAGRQGGVSRVDRPVDVLHNHHALALPQGEAAAQAISAGSERDRPLVLPPITMLALTPWPLLHFLVWDFPSHWLKRLRSWVEKKPQSRNRKRAWTLTPTGKPRWIDTGG